MKRTFALLSVLICSTSAYAVDTYFATLGDFENPPTGSTATGDATIAIDGNNMNVLVNWSGLTGGNPAAAHIHCCVVSPTNVGVAVGFPGFPATTSGTYSHLFDLSDPSIYTDSYRNAFGGGTAAGAKTALINALNAGSNTGAARSYVNIHNAQFGGGEIRGFPAPVPEPASIALAGTSLGALWLVRRRTKM